MTMNDDGHQSKVPVQHRRKHLEQPSSDSKLITIKRRIGNTTYDVLLHFSASGDETVENKIMKLIAQDASQEVV